MEIALNKKQPTRVCGPILIGEFLDQNGEIVNQVVEEEKEHQDVEFQKEIEDEGHEKESLNEGEDHEIIVEEGNNTLFPIFNAYIYYIYSNLNNFHV